jgi:hypothetical protein
VHAGLGIVGGAHGGRPRGGLLDQGGLQGGGGHEGLGHFHVLLVVRLQRLRGRGFDHLQALEREGEGLVYGEKWAAWCWAEVTLT